MMSPMPRPKPTAPKLPRAKARAPLVLAELARLYPDSGIELFFETPLQLAVATILSAQCTDKRVNMVTPALFARFPDAESLAAAPPGAIAELVKSTGFFNAKARNIQAFAQQVLSRFGGRVPETLEELVTLPGIGRKTANVVLGDAFGQPGITVDTHVGRLSRRLGFTKHTDPVKVEFELMGLWPRAEWTAASHRVILHGRAVCSARKPACERCTLLELCPRVGVAAPRPLPTLGTDPAPDLRVGTVPPAPLPPPESPP